jgi:hypothetical protein
MKRFAGYMGWPAEGFRASAAYTPAVTMTTYNGATPVEVDASARLLKSLQKAAGGRRMEQVMWAASGSETIQKAIWAAMA